MTTLQRLQAIIKANFNLEPEVLQPDARLKDLEIDSLAVIEIMFCVEDEFKVVVPPEKAESEKLETVGDLVNYIDMLVDKQQRARPRGGLEP